MNQPHPHTLPATPRNERILLAANINPRELKVAGWKGSRRKGLRPESWILPEELLPAYETARDADALEAARVRKAAAEQAACTRRRNKIFGLPTAAQRRELARKEREADALSLGLLPDSRTYALYECGEITKEEAIRRGQITSYRHERTNYDDLLRAGYCKEEARELLTEVEPSAGSPISLPPTAPSLERKVASDLTEILAATIGPVFAVECQARPELEIHASQTCPIPEVEEWEGLTDTQGRLWVSWPKVEKVRHEW